MEGCALHFSFKLYSMALYYGLPVFKDVYKLTLLIYSLTKDFSEEEEEKRSFDKIRGSGSLFV
ncbi:MAG: hypothetical protein ACI9CP_001002 [Cryomorphaceae bacterium]|jgi:hypothetical protein